MALIREHRLVRLLREADIYTARELAAEMAAVVGFDGYQVADIETAVSELCSNALKFGDRGWAVLRVVAGEFEAVITDEGPGFGAPTPEKRGLGVGLGGAERLMDDLEIGRVGNETRAVIRKRLPLTDSPHDAPSRWRLGVVTRIRVGRSISGDRWWVSPTESRLLLAVVDGLGSGEKAAEASSCVIDTLSDMDAGAPLAHMVEHAHKAAVGTRGAVGIVVRVDDSGLEYCGVGDVAGRVEPSGETLVPQPGVMGVEIPDLVSRRVPWSAGSRVAVWTDGLKPPVDVLERAQAGDLGEWLDEVACAHGTERDDGLLALVVDTFPNRGAS
jgi:anti-sigma regulatory factor (Ser/Thr protein kinase)